MINAKNKQTPTLNVMPSPKTNQVKKAKIIIPLENPKILDGQTFPSKAS